MQFLMCIFFSFLTLGTALRNCIFCKLNNSTQKETFENSCDYYICLTKKARCIKIVTVVEENHTEYVTRACSGPRACNGGSELDIERSAWQPGSGKIYCCDRGGCNKGETVHNKLTIWRLFITFVISFVAMNKCP